VVGREISAWEDQMHPMIAAMPRRKARKGIEGSECKTGNVVEMWQGSNYANS